MSSCSDKITFRSNHQKCSIKKEVLKNFANFTRKRMCQNFFFNKVAALRTATLLKRRPWHRFSKNTFLTEYLWTTGDLLCNILRKLIIQIQIHYSSNKKISMFLKGTFRQEALKVCEAAF